MRGSIPTTPEALGLPAGLRRNSRTAVKQEDDVSVRVGILGVGVMGSDHARILASQVPGATVQAIYDADPKRAKAIVDEIGSGTVVADALALIKDASVDAVLVASPDQTHKELTLA